jgi:hypothetical protein
MIVEETFYRTDELRRQASAMSGATYNLAHQLVAHSPQGCVFVPIRSMQYLAVLDAQEFIFIDSQGDRHIELAWQSFHPQSRTALDEPVPFELVYYRPQGEATMRWLPGEFYKAMLQVHERQSHGAPRAAKIIRLTTTARGPSHNG